MLVNTVQSDNKQPKILSFATRCVIITSYVSNIYFYAESDITCQGKITED